MKINRLLKKTVLPLPLPWTIVVYSFLAFAIVQACSIHAPANQSIPFYDIIILFNTDAENRRVIDRHLSPSSTLPISPDTPYTESNIYSSLKRPVHHNPAQSQ